MSETGAEPSVFSRIVARDIPATIVAETERIIAFVDINPQAPVHIVVTTKTEAYRNVVELAAGDPGLLAELVAVAGRVATELSDGQFRLVFNTGAAAGQTVFHVHAHVLALKPSEDGATGSLGEGTLGSV
ncbi:MULTISPECIES: HIT domain-containing protein [Cryobacterium]|uniref:HIT domain-containing protein n=1 Tax=Cryobacterium glucosi TaxID=1259175 RepID=A0ABY2IRY9_9MICO|nr:MULTISPECIES: HIT domain-containing protein [Cryobacterium]MDY7527602.1 HIT domain-containing protein [Cryobacterium sp. 10C2]MDY7556618.1 HIT domain-containing protein [Cryobacterium sp. 10C3]MEB0002787.1 HIT domain-containing protein [Cryobacterium sp. RTC2.1]MEB0200585.1 HIT domain-containing protein [Cryobacterium sp. 5I3]MEB0286931.1 HIT domain-containing protein [Cryobacterium sp. 10S3]